MTKAFHKNYIFILWGVFRLVDRIDVDDRKSGIVNRLTETCSEPEGFTDDNTEGTVKKRSEVKASVFEEPLITCSKILLIILGFGFLLFS